MALLVVLVLAQPSSRYMRNFSCGVWFGVLLFSGFFFPKGENLENYIWS